MEEAIEVKENEDQWCFTWLAGHELASGQDRGALVKDEAWPSGKRITVGFLDGEEELWDKVMRFAQQWTTFDTANLTFIDQKHVDRGTQIRISFQYSGSWSVIGKSCTNITDPTKPTMNFGWLTPQSSDDEIRRVVLHEFGHAVGLIHEHQNPGGRINWNRQAVIHDLSGPPNNWSLDVIERNMFEPWEKSETNFTELDPRSIMMYPIPKRWTTDGFSVGLNSDLSSTDKRFIHLQYH